MEKIHGPSEGHQLQGPHKDLGSDLPVGFVPLRLVLQPAGLRLEVTRPEAIVGRHSGADVRLALPEVSRRHCRLYFEAGHWRIEDLSSLNGVFLNGERMHTATLRNGDQVQLGQYAFRVEHAPAPPGAADPNVEILKSIADAVNEQRRAS
jgi:pSer/pThr/pTyr-binding forkhead associated (FHA) protein